MSRLATAHGGTSLNSFNARGTLSVGDSTYEIYRLSALKDRGFKVDRLPYTLRILLENLLRTEGSGSVFAGDIEALANWDPKAEPSNEIAFTPARVLLQDFTGVPCVVDLAAMREAMQALGGNPKKINPLQPVELVIDHSVQVDAYGSEAALMINRDLEFDRNAERYEFLKWGQGAFDNFRAVPPNTGIVHQVNLENLARITFVRDGIGSTPAAYPDTVVGTDSHTTMINGIGVLGWGVGGIEAEAAMLGQPISMLVPQVIGFRLLGKLREGSTATDLVLTVTEMLRKRGVVGKFVEFFGDGLSNLTLADRATIGNMSPEFGATCAVFPVDAEALNYMRLTARPEKLVNLTEAYYKEQGLFYEPGAPESEYTDVLELDLSAVEPSIAGPKRPQDRLLLSQAAANFKAAYPGEIGHPNVNAVVAEGAEAAANASADLVSNGSVVVAAITSCTNTSNPRLMTAAGLVAKKAVEKGLKAKPWVKTSLAPGSRVAGDILKKSGLQPYLNELNFNIVGYGCTTCIGNSGPLPEAISKAVNDKNLAVVSVLSGNRNFEGRINADVKANYLMSPPLVVAYALAGTIDIDLSKDELGKGSDGQPVYLKDIWPTTDEITEANAAVLNPALYSENYADVFKGDEKWAAIKTVKSDLFAWDGKSTYVKNPPYFEGMSKEAPTTVADLHGLRALAVLGDSITTDHISPAGSIKLNSPAGEYLSAHGVSHAMFNSYGSRRGNHEVMVRGTFANIRLRNRLAPETEGGWTTFLPTGEVTSIFAAAEQYKAAGTPLVVIAGKEYGSGSSRDWAAKGTFMLGVKAVLAISFERIHRSNLVGMGIVPLEFTDGATAESLGLSGTETFNLDGFAKAVAENFSGGKLLTMTATADDGSAKSFKVRVRIDTPQEVQYYRHGGILQYVLRSLL